METLLSDFPEEERPSFSDMQVPLIPQNSPSWRVLVNPAKPVPLTSIKASLLNLVCTMVGAGTLSIPYAFQSAGILTSLILLACVAGLSVFSCQLLVAAARRSGLHHPSYSEVAKLTMGAVGKHVVTTLIMFTIFFAAIAIIILQGQIVPSIWKYFYNPNWSDHMFRSIVMVVFSALVIPIASVHSISSLKFTSLLSLASLFFLAIILITKAFMRPESAPMPQLWIQPKMSVLLAMSIISVSFFCHMNVLPIHWELREPSVHRMDKLLYRSVMVVFFIYAAVGISGYFSFPGSVEGNILSNFNDSDTLVLFGRFAMAITLSSSLPLVVFPLRKLVLTHVFQRTSSTFLLSSAISAFITLSACGLAIVIPDVVLVWSFVGSTLCASISFVFPPLMYLIVRREHVFHDKSTTKAFLFLCLGIVVVISCTVESILNASEKAGN